MAKLDNKTGELPGLPVPPKKRGRPSTGKAKSAAQRMAESRARRELELDQAAMRASWVTACIECALVELRDGNPNAAHQFLLDHVGHARLLHRFMSSLRPDFYKRVDHEALHAEGACAPYP